MQISTWIVGIFGLFSLAGGIIGYVKAQSMASLIAGSISGILLLACAFGMKQGIRGASYGALLVAVLLGGRFLGTWLQHHKFMPDLVMVVLSAATLISVTATLFKK